MLVVRKKYTTDAAASPLPLQPLEQPADCDWEDGGKGYWIHSGQMLAYTYFQAFFHGIM